MKNTGNSSLNDATRLQIEVLQLMSENILTDTTITESTAIDGEKDLDFKVFSMNEIAARTSLEDEREVQRYLFILEGQKLVEPHPKGDLTSTFWKISPLGFTTLKRLLSMLQAA